MHIFEVDLVSLAIYFFDFTLRSMLLDVEVRQEGRSMSCVDRSLQVVLDVIAFNDVLLSDSVHSPGL